jgi:hypothetical protein
VETIFSRLASDFMRRAGAIRSGDWLSYPGLGGTPLPSGQICFAPVNINGSPITFLANGTTAGSTMLYCPSATFNAATDLGKIMDIEGAGNLWSWDHTFSISVLHLGNIATTIASVTDAHHLVMSNTAIATNAGRILNISLTYTGRGYAGIVNLSV